MKKTITVVLEVEYDEDNGIDIECDDDLQNIIDNSDIELMQDLRLSCVGFEEGDKLSEKPQHFSDRELAERGLPPFAWSTVYSPDQVIRIERGMMGYFPDDSGKSAERLNQEHGVTDEQAFAMQIGSMVGWHVPGAFPKKAAS